MMLPILTIVLGLAAMGIDPGEPKTYVQLTNVPGVGAEAGKTARVELKFRVTQGFHINSNVPRSSYLIPTKLSLNAPPEISVAKLIYPPGEDYAFAFAPDEKLNVYSGEFAISADLKLANTAKTGYHTIQGELTYQACNDRACFPPKNLPVRIDVQVLRVRMPKPRREPRPIDPTRG